jgi:hypothetical protein
LVFEVHREVLHDGAIRLTAGGGSFTFRRPRSGVLEVTAWGQDEGQFGTRALDELRGAIDRDGQLEIFIDAENASATAASVTDAWKRFLSVHRNDLARVHVLVGSKFMYLNIAITQHLAGAAEILRLYTDRAGFDEAKSARAGSSGLKAEG